MVQTAMGQELSWEGPARQYAQLYERLLAERANGSRRAGGTHSAAG
jgi:glycogen synthase